MFNVDALLGTIAGTLGTVIADTNGFASHPLPIPPGYLWDGSLGMQSVWLAPAHCGVGPFTSSNALR